MIRLDDDRYIDTSLISHVEYQLFIDEMRAQGKYYRPDYWLTYQFPSGQSHTPVVGVRPSDAEAFCQWLSQREADDWLYRLPYATELSADIQTANGCYWVKSDPTSARYPLFGSPYTTSLRLPFKMILAHMATRALVLDFDRAFDLALVRVPNHDRTLIRNRTRALFSQDIYSDRTLNHDRTLALVSGGDFTFVLSLNSVLCDLDLDNITDRADTFNLDSTLDHIYALEYALSLVTDRDFARDRTRAQYLDNALNSAISIALARALDRARTIGLVSDLKAELCLVLARDCSHPHALNRALDLALDLALDRALVRDLVRDHKDDPLIVYCMEIYFALAILEARMNGEYPAFEGIRFVKERRKDTGLANRPVMF